VLKLAPEQRASWRKKASSSYGFLGSYSLPRLGHVATWGHMVSRSHRITWWQSDPGHVASLGHMASHMGYLTGGSSYFQPIPWSLHPE
jgi:hypothetical protein